MARLVDGASASENIHEERESSIRRCDHPDDRRASALSSTAHASLQKARRLPRKGKTSPSAHGPQVDALQPATGIQFNTPIETTASDSEKQLQLCTLLFKWAERHSPHKQFHQHRHITSILKTRAQPNHHRLPRHLEKSSSGHRSRDDTRHQPAEIQLLGVVQRFTRRAFHQPLISCELLNSRMLEGRQWLPSVIPYGLAPFVDQTSCKICGVEFLEVYNCNAIDALPVAVLPDRALGDQHYQPLPACPSCQPQRPLYGYVHRPLCGSASKTFSAAKSLGASD
ncbi:hypothetical protein HPB50_007370 [Hyalomma asiaticum]|uniref:Uncharacterized protein n=1 Tax=Hyalomma asiaticum TaxID=266040 RepID=A0ACB7TG85_HYAAI|nr:hypothetical protein HPB50_007370 [Hyalomma asiaticum]